MDGGMEGGMDGGREGGMDGGREGGRDGGKDGWREGWMDGGMDGGIVVPKLVTETKPIVQIAGEGRYLVMFTLIFKLWQLFLNTHLIF